MFNLGDIIGSVTDALSGAEGVVADSVNQITEVVPGVDQLSEPLTSVTESLPEIPGLDSVLQSKQ